MRVRFPQGVPKTNVASRFLWFAAFFVIHFSGVRRFGFAEILCAFCCIPVNWFTGEGQVHGNIELAVRTLIQGGTDDVRSPDGPLLVLSLDDIVKNS